MKVVFVDSGMAALRPLARLGAIEKKKPVSSCLTSIILADRLASPVTVTRSFPPRCSSLPLHLGLLKVSRNLLDGCRCRSLGRLAAFYLLVAPQLHASL